MQEHDPLKSVYRRLVRKYHPDMTTDPRERVVYGDLTREIIDAYKTGDGDSLSEIERLGTAFRRQRMEPETPPAVDSTRPSPPVATGLAEDVHQWLRFLAPFVFPYALPFAIRSWNENQKATNAACIAGAIPWAWLGVHLWGGIDALSLYLIGLGYSHESITGLIVVLLRGALLCAFLPIAVSLGLVALRVGWLVGAAWVAHWVLAGVLGYFHPYLAWIATIGLGAGLAIAVWRSLDEW